MLPEIHSEVDFLDWLDTLDDETRQMVMDELRAIAAELGVSVKRKPLLAHNILDFPLHALTQLLPN